MKRRGADLLYHIVVVREAFVWSGWLPFHAPHFSLSSKYSRDPALRKPSVTLQPSCERVSACCEL